jgi:hypothetical protein
MPPRPWSVSTDNDRGFWLKKIWQWSLLCCCLQFPLNFRIRSEIWDSSALEDYIPSSCLSMFTAAIIYDKPLRLRVYFLAPSPMSEWRMHKLPKTLWANLQTLSTTNVKESKSHTDYTQIMCHNTKRSGPGIFRLEICEPLLMFPSQVTWKDPHQSVPRRVCRSVSPPTVAAYQPSLCRWPDE